MAVKVFHIQASWDPEVGVWVATSDDVPGLATEASTVEALAAKLHVMVPELLEANHLLEGERADEISFEMTSQRQEWVRRAS